MAMVLTMPEEKVPKEKPEYTTFRLFVQDGENLSELATKRGLTIAKLYHELFGEQVKKLLIADLCVRAGTQRQRDHVRVCRPCAR